MQTCTTPGKNISASELAIKEEREQIASSTATELLNLSRYQASLVIASQYAARMQELVNMLSQIAEADRGRASELTQARARLYSAEASKDQLRHQYDATKIKLVRLLGVEPVVPSGLRWNDGLVPAPVCVSGIK
ncbi:TolC family protein [Pantoea vagans]|uniref:TolC family protein n=1 Tax=Pantoea vagans TaxID=470934 RepID=UPI003B024A84